MARVLLINDEADLLEICELVLESAGHSVTRALGSSNGLTAAMKSGADVVLLNLVMPGMSGEEILRRIRQAHATAATPVVIMSALADARQRAEELGADEFLGKPFEPAALVGAIERALEKSRSGRAPDRQPRHPDSRHQ